VSVQLLFLIAGALHSLDRYFYKLRFNNKLENIKKDLKMKLKSRFKKALI
jgi:hypothetical protein